METQVNKSHQFAREMFSDECKRRVGITPIEDDKLVLKAACDFGAYIKTFKRLDHTVDWHRHFIDTLVDTKIVALEKRINQEYGSNKRYLDRLRERSGKSREAYQRDSVRTGTRTEELSTVPADSDDGR